MIKFYNTLTRKLQEFTTVKTKEVGIYSCGPTVYWNQHIGHMYAYVQWDTLVRFLRFMDYRVKWVMNITDVGHMTSDEDVGQDKMEKGAKREGLSVWEIADKYIGQFKESMELLNIQKPDVLCRATEHIQEQIDLIKKIEANGFTYQTKTGIVFDTAKFPGYADFARLNLKDQSTGARVEIDPEKKNPWDFLLWVTNQPKHIMQWDSPWGRGFPGWHIECTAMSTKYLGEQFDIHTGGKEHIPVHHTNEVAQGFGAFGRQTANFWLHNGWLELKGEKMSKSLGNVILASDLVKKGFNSLAFRYLILTSHYRQGIVFDQESLKGAQTAYDRLVSMIQGWSQDKRSEMGADDPEKIAGFRQKFIEAVSDDLNLPEALASVWQMAKSDIPSADKFDLISDFDRVLGLKLIEFTKAAIDEVPEEINNLVSERENFRKKKEWENADKIRKEIETKGFSVDDTAAGTIAKKIKANS